MRVKVGGEELVSKQQKFVGLCLLMKSMCYCYKSVVSVSGKIYSSSLYLFKVVFYLVYLVPYY